MVDPNPYQYQEQVPSESAAIEKPTSVTVFGILNCVFGGMGLLCTPFGMFVGAAAMQKTMQATAAYRIWMFVGGFVGIGFSCWLLALGIGLLTFKKWARRGCVAYACTVIVWNFIGVGVNIASLALHWITVPEASLPGFVGGTVGGMCGGLIYPILLLIFMQTDKVKRAFGGCCMGRWPG
ncbi:MAG: hypothetical protein WC476_05430 [Phycisphaerae bacterium]|jgi:hypothetical protein